jgi:DNA-binding HxlR family transcriptional regulator
MNRLILAALLAGGCRFGAVHAAPGPTEPALRDELLQMEERDQVVRKVSHQGDFSKLAQTDAANQKRIKEIVARYG